jgi:polysaccharide transporter, PST family
MTALAEKARLSVLWTTGFSLFRDVLQLGLTLTLTRLLPHEAYGYFGFVSAVTSFATVISFREFLYYTMQVRTDDETHYQDQFTAGAVIQAVLFVAVNLVAVALRSVPGYAPVAPLLHVTSLMLPIDLVCEFRIKMLERQFEWRRHRTLFALGLVIGAVTAVVLAVNGAGAYALVVPPLVIPLPFAWDLFVTAGWRPTWAWSRERYAPARRFGVTRIGSASLASVSALAESTMLTRAIGFAQLGIYNRAISLAVLFCQRAASLLLEALYPVITRVQTQSDHFRRATALVTRCVVWILVPMAVVLSISGEAVVRVLYGTRWLAVAPLLAWTVWLGAAMGLVQTGYVLLLAHQQQRHCFTADALRLVGTVAALLVALPLGLRVYVGSLVVMNGAIFLLTLAWLLQSGALAARSLMATFVPPVAGSAVALVVARAVSLSIGAIASPIWSGALFGALFGLVYVGFLRACCGRWMREIVSYLPHRQRIEMLLRLPAAA